ncbi:tail sheath protein [Stenotrophomonas maltophilia phage vB_SmaM_Ps15]|uniref:Tail sheath protein n=1 Tax=Stenotrophomonas maltophilia phage vB_SmaM_Ps15 TaxID=3071007 RepID=A0AAE9JUY4_9CAUD|nr:tail sheath [Stenotrophomonas maltophilia phage vB_SmaM_Ps15]UMO77252.1 tail sheath protein [Stenotrophomonas maltophilia phage vB_SmaM_Ps15]
MASNNSSPDVQSREIDLTNGVATAGSTSGAFAGDFQWGPVDSIITVSNNQDIETSLGKPTDTNYVSWFSASNFLAYTGLLQVSRAVDENAINASDDGGGLLIKNRQHFEQVSTAPTSVKYAAKYPGLLGDSLEVHLADSATFSGWAYASQFDTAPGTSFWAQNLGIKNDEVHVVVIDRHGLFTGVPNSVLRAYSYLSKASDSKDSNGGPNFYRSVLNRDSQHVWSLALPTTAELVDGNDGTVDAITVSDGGQNYTVAPTVTLSAPAPGGVQATATATVAAGVVTGITVVNKGSGYTSAPTVTISGDGTGATATATLKTVTGSEWGKPGIQAGLPVTFKSLAQRQELPLSGGKDSTQVGAQELIQALEPFQNEEEVDVGLLFLGDSGGETSHAAVTQWAIDNLGEARKDLVVFWSPKLSDVLNKTQNDATNLCKTTIAAVGRASSYAFGDTGWKLQYDAYNDKYRWIPLNADIAGLCARVDNTSDPWNSPGGYNRGKLLNVVSLAFNPNKTSRDLLYKASLNPVVTFRTDGTLLYGDKTMLGKNSAFSDLGIRRLFITLRKNISQASKQYLFEKNNAFTRNSFINMVTPYLQQVKGRNGISDFLIKCDEQNNTAQVIQNKQFVGSIFIKPEYSINWVELNFVAVRQDVAFEEVQNVQF